jgi:hypothetical protein
MPLRAVSEERAVAGDQGGAEFACGRGEDAVGRIFGRLAGEIR